MGRLKEVRTGKTVHLAQHVLVGRTRNADLRLSGNWISGEHAVLHWAGRWYLRDLGSKNGITINKKRISVGTEYPLSLGAQIAFGQAEEEWILDSTDPPIPMAIAHNGAIRLGLDNVLVLPDEEHDWARIEHKDARWVLKDRQGERVVVDRDPVVVGPDVWTLRLPEQLDHTIEALNILVADIEVVLIVSQDKETINVQIQHQGRRIDLAPLSHHEVLRLLGLQQQSDRDAGLPIAELGWMYASDLADDLKTDRDRLNTHVKRIREQFVRAGVVDGKQIIERRPSGQIRIAPIPVSIRTN